MIGARYLPGRPGLLVRASVLACAAGLLAPVSTHALAPRSVAARPTEMEEPPVAAPSLLGGATTATVEVRAEARARPGAGRHLWLVGTATTWSAEPQTLLVLGSAIHRGREWVRVLLPIRPDGTSGWIPRDNVRLLITRYWITVDKAARTVTIYDRGHRLHSFAAVIGKPATPTPDGLAAIYEKDPQPDPTGFLGPWALPLTALSNVLYNFGGGPGRVAIHGRDGASLDDPLGSALSHGCIRIDNDPIVWMARHIPQGTPVQIV
jgi:lipoprotein-anchoring transpeptidase ErfK/SrfK